MYESLKAKLAALKTRALDFLTGRMSIWLWLSFVLVPVVIAIAPKLVSTTIYKALLLIGAAWAGYWFDRHLFPYARPDSYLRSDNWKTKRDKDGKVADDADYPVADDYHAVFAFAMLRRAIIIGCSILGSALAV